MQDSFGIRDTLEVGGKSYQIASLARLGRQFDLQRLPYSIKILLENLLRNEDGSEVTREQIEAVAKWNPEAEPSTEIAFLPARVVLQDFTGVPCVVDLAAMRDAVRELGGDPKRINPLVPADLVIDHSVQVDLFGSTYAFAGNVEREYERNGERYALLRWAQSAFNNFRVVPPGTGIIHQVNLEYLGKVVMTKTVDGETVAFPDTLVGTDSHTTMINGLGVLGWGVGGIEAEAVMLGQPLYQLTPVVVGMRLTGQLPEGATATDLVLTVTQQLRKHGVVNKFVEFSGPGLSNLSLPDRATIANMTPEFGATATLFPVDAETLAYLRLTGRDESLIDLVERYTKAQGLFRTDATPDPQFDEKLELDLSTVEPSLAGPRRPQDRVALKGLKQGFRDAYADRLSDTGTGADAMNNEGDPTQPAAAKTPVVTVTLAGETADLTHGSVVIAAITSCTNTSNPSVMVGAGLLAKKAVERGLTVKPYVKTSLAPGSKVVMDYYERAGLVPYLDDLGFALVGYGCTTCIYNSGPLPENVSKAGTERQLVAAAVLSGNLNFEGRIHPLVKANFLASPPLVVAYALAGSVEVNLASEPLANDSNGHPVYLRDVWPSQEEILETLERAVSPEMFRRTYANVWDGNPMWNAIPVSGGDLYEWRSDSTYIQEPPFFTDPSLKPRGDLRGARVLVFVGDSVTTDHISPAGSIPADSPAGRYLIEHGVDKKDFNSYGSRRGNDRVMVRGTFANIRLRNLLAPGTEGGVTIHLPSGEKMSIYDAAMRYKAEGVPLIALAGKEYGSGSSRDWAAKGTLLLGIKAVLAESYERFHRSNLIGMGVLPLQFKAGESAASLGLTGREVFDIEGLTKIQPRQDVQVTATAEDGTKRLFQVTARLDSPIEVKYYRNGGILETVLQALAANP